MDPLAAGTYNPSVGSLPQIVSQNEMLMMPVLQNYSEQVAQLDNLSGNLNPNSVFTPVSNPTTQFNYENYYDQMAANQARMSQYNMAQQERMRRESLIANAPMEKIQTQAMILQEKIAQNEQDQIRGAFDAFVQAVRECYDPDGQADEGAIKARAISEYQRLTGRNIIADIRECGSSTFGNGFLRGITFGLFGDKNTAEDNIAYITGQEKPSNEGKVSTAGKVAGGAAAGAAIGSIIPGIGTAIGAVGGAIVGGILGLFS